MRRGTLRLALSLWPGAVLLSTAGCSPRFDWREARMPGDEIRMLLPGRPASLTRRIHLRDEPVSMTMVGAEAGELAFTIAIATAERDRPLPERLADMRDQMLRNIAVDVPAGSGSKAAPEPATATLAIVDAAGRTTGRRDALAVDARGNGPHAAIRLQGRFFVARGAAAQAVVLGRAFDDDAARQFFGSLRVVEP